MKGNGVRAVRHGLWSRMAFYVVVSLAILVWAFPILWVIYCSFKPSDLIISRELTAVFKPTLEHYRTILSTRNFGIYLKNSLMVAVPSTIVSVVCGFLAAYSMARFKTGGGLFSLWVLITRMAPPAAVLIPFYLLFRSVELINTLWALIIVNVSLNLSFAIWLLKTFISEIPQELEDAAIIDGATRFQALGRVVLPLSLPGLVATTTFCFIFAWNEFLFALVLAAAENVKTLPVAVGDFVTAYAIEWGPVFGAGSLTLIPVIVAVLFLQKYIVRGLTFGALK